MDKPIGIFDSGVGGLSIAKAIQQKLPSENLLYIADQKFSPYGEQLQPMIAERCNKIVNYLVKQDCKAVVVACNTATVNTIQQLRQHHSIPIIGVEPGIKPAAESSRSGTIGVLATRQTLASNSFQQLTKCFSEHVKIETQACPDFVELVENNDLNSPKAKATSRKYLEPLLERNADHIVLGCTHYSFLSETIEMVLPRRAVIIDTAVPVAAELERRLHDQAKLQTDTRRGSFRFWSSNLNEDTSHIISELMGYKITASPIPDLK